MTQPISCGAQAQVHLVVCEDDDLYVLPRFNGTRSVARGALMWVLSPTSEQRATLLRVGPGFVAVGEGRILELPKIIDRQTMLKWPRCDAAGNGFSFKITHGDLLEEALAAFYWDTMIPCVVERTAMAGAPDSDGFVLSSPSTDRFKGTYPSCDHEFGIKGRIAIGGELDLAVVRRMIDLALKVMRENSSGFWGCPCAIQPDGEREYFWVRPTLDGSDQAQMFRLSGNAEVLEAAWLYFASTKDRVWLEERIEGLEKATRQIERYTNKEGWLDGGAFYEDAVIKSGPSCETTALAANALRLLSELEAVLNRQKEAERFRKLAERIGNRIQRPFPEGFWDQRRDRFIDWIDRRGKPHDHINLLANALPVVLGWCTNDQSGAVRLLMDTEFKRFQRFPTFVAARIKEYDESEIGIHGPFDSCAMARIWCWDAALWSKFGYGGVLLQQLLAVAQRGLGSGWRMAERYNMRHGDFKDTQGWHGSGYYYEYPCVFAWVLIHEYLGIRPALDVELEIDPKVIEDGEVSMAAYGISYRIEGGTLTVKNLCTRERTFRICGKTRTLCAGSEHAEPFEAPCGILPG